MKVSDKTCHSPGDVTVLDSRLLSPDHSKQLLSPDFGNQTFESNPNEVLGTYPKQHKSNENTRTTRVEVGVVAGIPARPYMTDFVTTRVLGPNSWWEKAT